MFVRMIDATQSSVCIGDFFLRSLLTSLVNFWCSNSLHHMAKESSSNVQGRMYMF